MYNMILFTHATFLWATRCLICFITIVKPFLILILTTVQTVYLVWKKGSRRVWSIDRGCLLLHGIWSHLWYIQRSVYACSLICISYRTYEIEYCSLFLSFHVQSHEPTQDVQTYKVWNLHKTSRHTKSGTNTRRTDIQSREQTQDVQT
jgi:hypothetical protein